MAVTPLEMIQGVLARQDDVSKQELKKDAVITRKKERENEKSRSQTLQRTNSVDQTGEETAISSLTEDHTILVKHTQRRRIKDDENKDEKLYYKDQDLGSKIDILT
jgi:hypothetical protein